MTRKLSELSLCVFIKNSALSFIKTVLLSGGIGLEEIAAVNEITKTNLPFIPLM
jgi:hypothetical protein